LACRGVRARVHSEITDISEAVSGRVWSATEKNKAA